MGRPGRQRGWVGSRAAASWVLRPNDHAMETVTCAPYAGAVRRLRAFFRVKVGTQGAACKAGRPGHPGWGRRCRHAMHEGGVLLDEGGVYCG